MIVFNQASSLKRVCRFHIRIFFEIFFCGFDVTLSRFLTKNVLEHVNPPYLIGCSDCTPFQPGPQDDFYVLFLSFSFLFVCLILVFNTAYRMCPLFLKYLKNHAMLISKNVFFKLLQLIARTLSRLLLEITSTESSFNHSCHGLSWSSVLNINLRFQILIFSQTNINMLPITIT